MKALFSRHSMWWLLFILFFSVSNQATECVDDPTVCSYYCEKHKELGCDKKNYLVNFGYRYCRLFVDKEHTYSKDAQIVLSNIRSCLVNHLAKQPRLSCDTVADVAVESHVECYQQNNFCDLSSKDQMITLWYIKSGLFDPFFQKTMKLIIDQCKSQQTLRKKLGK